MPLRLPCWRAHIPSSRHCSYLPSFSPALPFGVSIAIAPARQRFSKSRWCSPSPRSSSARRDAVGWIARGGVLTVLQAIVLGALQGLAEFLPISSSAHLALTPWILGWESPGLAFDVALHLGTLAAVLWFFRAQWATLARAAWQIVL